MPAKRMSRVIESGTVKMSNIVSQMKAKGEKIISFNMGEPDFKTPDHIVAATKQALDEGFTHYTPSNGIPELREAIAQHERECGVECKAENIIVTPTKHTIFMTMLALVDDGDEVLLPEPAFVSYEPCISLAGGKAVPIKTVGEEGFQLTPEMVHEKLTKKTKLLVLNSPSNPTGAVYTRENLKGIAEVCNDAKLNVFSDEIYKKLIYDGEHVSIASFDGMAERTVVADGFSKPYAMTGWRIGWLVAPKQIFGELAKLQQHSMTCATSFVQKGALAAIRGSQEPVNGMLAEFRARRDLIVKLLNDSRQFECRTPDGAFYVFPKYKVEMTSEKFTEKLLTEAKVAVTAGSAFGKAGEGHIRISYAASREAIKEGVRHIVSSLEK